MHSKQYVFRALFIVSAKSSKNVFPAKAGIHRCNKLGANVEMDSRLRGEDKVAETMNKAVFLVLMCFLTSCAVGPDYVRPPVIVSTHFKEAKGKAVIAPKRKGWKLAEPREAINRGEWWKIFSDPKLNELEDQLNACNQTLVNAAANYRQAAAIVSEARAGLFPNVAGVFNVIRQTQGSGTTSFTSSSVQSGASTGTATTGAISKHVVAKTSYAEYLNANWEPDIWGQVRRTIESDEAAAQASGALWAATRLSAQGALAQYYFQLRALDMDQKLLDHTVMGYKETLQLTRHQYASGIVDRADIVQAQSQVEVAEAQAINNGILRSQYEHAIAVLIGRLPANFSLSFMPLNTTPPAIPIAVPTAWLERRPDIAQAERLMQQTNAQIGMAISTYYPALNLSGSVSGAGTNLGDLINYPVAGWSLGLYLVETIYDGGLRAATVRAAKAAYAAQVATYRQTVLTAFQNVEDMLCSLRILEKQGLVENKAAASAQWALKLVTNQYKAGIVPYSSILTAQIAAYTAQKNAADIIGLQMISAVGLVEALGGGWNEALLCTPNAGVKEQLDVSRDGSH